MCAAAAATATTLHWKRLGFFEAGIIKHPMSFDEYWISNLCVLCPGKMIRLKQTCLGPNQERHLIPPRVT